MNNKKIVLEFGNAEHIKLRDNARKEWLYKHIILNDTRGGDINEIADRMNTKVDRCVKCLPLRPNGFFEIIPEKVNEEKEKIIWSIRCSFFDKCSIRNIQKEGRLTHSEETYERECSCDCLQQITTSFEGDLIE